MLLTQIQVKTDVLQTLGFNPHNFEMSTPGES